jgi:ubiquinone/menaquinone biosynthesis C-methylase UbiE
MDRNDPYRRVATAYDRFIEPMLTGVRNVALNVLPPQPGWRVLDVGCGTGASLATYLEAGCTVAGVDVSSAMLEQARARLADRAELHLVDGDTLPFDADTFDLVLTTMVLHEVDADARSVVIEEMARVTRPEGRLLLTDFRFGSLRGWRGPTFRTLSWVIERFSGHYSGYKTFRAAGGVPALMADAGLNVEREKIVGGGSMAIYVVSR